jgi:hypothetical protein
MQPVPIMRDLTNICEVSRQFNVSQCSIKKIFLNQTIHSRSSICSFLGLMAHIQLLIEPKKLIWSFYYYLDEVYTPILYFKLLATTTDFAICHMTLFGCRPGGEVQHFYPLRATSCSGTYSWLSLAWLSSKATSHSAFSPQLIII